MSGLGTEAVSYWPAGAALTPYVSAYHRFSAAAPPGQLVCDVFFPSWATIRITLHDSPAWSLKMGNRTYGPMPDIAFVGPTSYAGYMASGGGTLVGAGILPLGWAQMFGGDLSRFSNRVVPLEDLDPGAHMLRDAMERGMPPPEAFDAWLEARLHRRPPADERIARLFDMLLDPEITRTDTIAEALGMTSRALATMTRINFGFTPKLMLRRTRFLRALSGVLQHPDDGEALLEAAGYWDRSHFLRDSHLFLGCSIREFNKRRGPLNQAAIRARADAVGSPV